MCAVFLEKIIDGAIIYAEHAQYKTVTASDIVYTLKRCGITLYGYGCDTSFATPIRPSRKSIIGTKPYNHDPIVVGDSEEEKEAAVSAARQEEIIVVDGVDERTLERISAIFDVCGDATNSKGEVTEFGKEILFTVFNIAISRRQLCTLRYGKWLDDNAIDAYVCYLRKTNTTANDDGTVHMQSQTLTALFMNYVTISTKRLKRRNEKVLDCVNPEDVKQIYIVLHLDVHWVLVVVDVVARHLLIYDSLSGSNKLTKEQHFSSYGYSSAALQIITNNFKTFGPDASKKKEWHVGINVENLTTPDSIPRQKNGNDCGVFMLMNMDRLSHNRKLDYTQTDIRVYRKKIAAAIIKNAETNS